MKEEEAECCRQRMARTHTSVTTEGTELKQALHNIKQATPPQIHTHKDTDVLDQQSHRPQERATKRARIATAKNEGIDLLAPIGIPNLGAKPLEGPP